jgi:hypothetical protein
VLRILIGCCFAALSRFSTSIEEDTWLLEAARAAAAGSPLPPLPASTLSRQQEAQQGPGNAGSAAGAQQEGQGATTSAAAAAVGGLTPQQVAASEELQLALRYRTELKRVLIEALQGLSSRVKEVAAMKDLKQAAVMPLKKGQKPRPATKAGFGSN